MPDIRWKWGEEYVARRRWVNAAFLFVYAAVIGWLWMRWLAGSGWRLLRRLLSHVKREWQRPL
jgi:hypothetical protein